MKSASAPDSEEQELVVVRVKDGQLRGRRRATVWGLPFCSFQGVPYARPPVGDLRFREPQPLEPWSGVRDALQEGAVAVSVHHDDFSIAVGNEDCLYLNVYTPQRVPGDGGRLAVMVWLHGGGFVWGSGSADCYGPDVLMHAAIVLVTLNYRLGVLGFLSTQDEVVPGNMGLKDQVAALRWVRDNIASFGGDPNNVTIFGESAGAASVHYHLLSPLSKGLFHKAIMQSGSALSMWAAADGIREKSFKLGELLGCHTDSSEELVQFLRGVDPHKLVETFPKVVPEKEQMGALTVAFVPCVEKEHSGAFLTEEPLVLMTQGRFHRVPVIVGGTSGEGIAMLALTGILKDTEKMDFMIDNFELVFGDSLLIKDLHTRKTVCDKLKQFYFGNTSPDDRHRRLVLMCADLHFNMGSDITARLIASAPNPPQIYRYQFSFESDLALTSRMVDRRFPGATHTAELCYLFLFADNRQDINKDSHQHTVRSIMASLWTNFAKTGDPTYELNDVVTEHWPAYTLEDPAFADIGQELKIKRNINSQYFNFWWDTYYPARLQSAKQ
ncbi:esterase FE4-like [Schistocerca gregaria]|uniref:esterase FE4-like n=1 Tax=Schistocerca gregaria TaxID=7010 RepID=UPI00211E0FC9|nr:esterase FE4-like [Schistocerca gregaria]